MKDKITIDQVAMIVADFEHGELTTCSGTECKNCAFNKEMSIGIVGNTKITMCNMLVEMSVLMNEVDK